jgi:hypothetical protein
MKKLSNSFLFFIIVVGFMSFQTDDVLCDAKVLKEKAKDMLDPYKYDSSELTKIIYKKKESVKEVEVPLFIGEKYRFCFNMEAVPKAVEIQIYNKDKDSKNRKLLFSSKDSGLDKKEIQFEISKSRHVFVDYIVPPAEKGSYMGCAVFAVGYK